MAGRGLNVLFAGAVPDDHDFCFLRTRQAKSCCDRANSMNVEG